MMEMLGAACDAQGGAGHAGPGDERGAVGTATHRTMTMGDPVGRQGGFEGNGATEAGTLPRIAHGEVYKRKHEPKGRPRRRGYAGATAVVKRLCGPWQRPAVDPGAGGHPSGPPPCGRGARAVLRDCD